MTSADFVGGAGSPVVTASADGTARIWDVLVQPELLEVARFPAPVTLVQFRSGKAVHAATPDSQSAVDLATGKPSRSARFRPYSPPGASSGPGDGRRRFAETPSSFVATGHIEFSRVIEIA